MRSPIRHRRLRTVSRQLRWYTRLFICIGVTLATAMSGGGVPESFLSPSLASAVGMHDADGALGSRGPLEQLDPTEPLAPSAPDTKLCKRAGPLSKGASATFEVVGETNSGPVREVVTFD